MELWNKITRKKWNYGALKPCDYGNLKIMELWYHVTMEPRNYGAFEPCDYGTLKLRSFGTM